MTPKHSRLTRYADAERIKTVINKYSNFVSFPIEVDGEIVNTVNAVWLQDKNTVTEEEYNGFYTFLAGAYDKPMYTLHFMADAPLDMKALFFFPTFHTEKFGMQVPCDMRGPMAAPPPNSSPSPSVLPRY